MGEHLKKKRAEAMAIYKAENPDEEEEAVAVALARKKTIADAALSKKHTLPVQRPEIMRRITLDIAMDKAHAKATLGAVEDEDENEIESPVVEEKDEEDEAVDAIIASKATEVSPIAAARKRMTLRRIATNTALKRYQTSLNKNTASPEESVAMKRTDTKALKALENADPNDNMKAAALVARAKLATRKATKMQRRGPPLIRPANIEQAMNFDIKKEEIAA